MKERELMRSGTGRTIKVDYRRKNNTMPKTYAQQQIICAIVRDNSLWPAVKSRVTASAFTDGDMREAFTRYAALKERGMAVSYSVLAGGLSDSAMKTLGGIFARNADIIITEKDVLMHIENLITAKLSPGEASEKTVDEIAERLKILREKKK